MLSALSSQLSGERLPRLSLVAACVAAVAFGPCVFAQQLDPQSRMWTHDYTRTGSAETRTAWADAKSPGDGLVYVAGTTEVLTSAPDPGNPSLSAAQFSDHDVLPAGLLPTFTTTAARQVVILQVNDATTQQILWQRFFYGETGTILNPDWTRATNARGISVWPGATPEDTRIAICGETYDERLPSSQDPIGWSAATSAHPSGYIAMFKGNGDLLWSHHFFGAISEGDCAITDVCVHLQFDSNGNPVNDFVTYCGISTHGNPPGGNLWLTPANWFTAPSPGQADGAADNSSNGQTRQWDGIVGRLSHGHATPGPAQPMFHAIVGGREQDGLFGLDVYRAEEDDEDLIVAVGSTGRTASTAVGGTSLTFPLTTSTNLGSAPADYFLGVAMIFRFDPSPTPTLSIDASQDLGSIQGGSGEHRHTIARDVCVTRNAQLFTPGIDNTVFMVGSTDDPNFFAAMPLVNPTRSTLQGVSDGFVVPALEGLDTLTGRRKFTPLTGAFHGGPGADGLTGVNCWNEYVDHCAVTGFTDRGNGAGDIDVATFYVNQTSPVSFGSLGLVPLTEGQRGGSDHEHPAAMGQKHATRYGYGRDYETLLGEPAGGGVAMDQRARVNAVGETLSNDIVPTTSPEAQGRLRILGASNGVRAALDMLPANFARTDLTGPAAKLITWGGSPPAPAFGGTTPFPALGSLGRQLGRTDPALWRMCIDYEGPAPGPGVQAAIVVDRPPASAGFIGSFFMLGFPSTLPINDPLFPGIEMWLIRTNSVLVFHVPVNWETARFELSWPPGMPPANFSVQSVWMFATPLVVGGNSYSFAASPALFF